MQVLFLDCPLLFTDCLEAVRGLLKMPFVPYSSQVRDCDLALTKLKKKRKEKTKKYFFLFLDDVEIFRLLLQLDSW